MNNSGHRRGLLRTKLLLMSATEGGLAGATLVECSTTSGKGGGRVVGGTSSKESRTRRCPVQGLAGGGGWDASQGWGCTNTRTIQGELYTDKTRQRERGPSGGEEVEERGWEEEEEDGGA